MNEMFDKLKNLKRKIYINAAKLAISYSIKFVDK